MKISKYVFGLSVLVFVLLAVRADAATYYASPGEDLLPKTSALYPGDTLILADGTYRPLHIDCSANARNGNEHNPITLRAENERRARFLGDGGDVLSLTNCSYWIIDGLRLENVNRDSNVALYGNNFLLLTSDHIIARRNFVHHSNQGSSLTGYNNIGLMLVMDSENILVEENEFWDSGRNLLQFSNRRAGYGNHIARRNYLNYGAAIFHEAGGITPYPTSNLTVENNFLDGLGIDVEAAYGLSSENNKILGNLGLESGIKEVCRTLRPLGGVWKNNVIVNPSGHSVGFSAEGSENLVMENNTSVGGYGNFALTSGYVPGTAEGCAPGPASWSLTAKNNLGLNGINYGFIATDADASHWSSDHDNIYGSAFYISVSSATSAMQIAPGRQENCPAFILPDSPYKNAGAGGADIGANVLYATENGISTGKPIWDISTGEINSSFIGAVVPGVNDGSQSEGKTLSNFGSRLQPNCTSADFSAAYRSTGGLP